MTSYRYFPTGCESKRGYRLSDYNLAVEIFAADPFLCRYLTNNGDKVTGPIKMHMAAGVALSPPGYLVRLNPDALLDAWFIATDSGLRPARGQYMAVSYVYAEKYPELFEGPLEILVPRNGLKS